MSHELSPDRPNVKDTVDPHRDIVGRALEQLGLNAAASPVAIHLVAGGLSGARVYRFDLGDEPVILKITPPDEPHYVIDQARRELRFYQDLATRIPLAVPRLLATDQSDTNGILLLLTAHRPAPPPDNWTVRDYIEVAQQLGHFHATFSDQTARSTQSPWLNQPTPLTQSQANSAAHTWQALRTRTDLTFPPSLQTPDFERLVLSLPSQDATVSTTPLTLCHGDAHPGNLLHDPGGQWLWADWQEVHLGAGVNDLTFLWQRSFAATENTPPLNQMIQAYLAGAESVRNDQIPHALFEHAFAWSGLRSWLIEWPEYLSALPTYNVTRILHRISALLQLN